MKKSELRLWGAFQPILLEPIVPSCLRISGRNYLIYIAYILSSSSLGCSVPPF